MSTTPKDAQRLVDRLRLAAEEIESAARYGVPIPPYVSVTASEYGDVGIPMDADEFDAWVDYTEAEVEDYEYEGRPWSRAHVDVNGLPLSFAVQR